MRSSTMQTAPENGRNGGPLAIHRASDCRDVVHVSPVHADEVDGAVARNTRRGAQRIGKEGTKLRLAHLARGHRELAMASGGHCMPPRYRLASFLALREPEG